MNPRSRRRLGAFAVLALVIGASVWARNALGIEWSVDSLNQLVDRLGVWAPVGFVAIVAFRTALLLPSQLVLTVGGLAFGGVQGALLGTLGLLLNGAALFVLLRWLGADSVRLRSSVPPGMRRTLEAAGSRGGAIILALATGYPVGPIAILHGAAALTPMPWPTYLVAGTIGCALRASLYSFFGSSLMEGEWTRVGVALAVITVSMLPFAHPTPRRWIRRQLELGPELTDREPSGEP